MVAAARAAHEDAIARSSAVAREDVAGRCGRAANDIVVGVLDVDAAERVRQRGGSGEVDADVVALITLLPLV